LKGRDDHWVLPYAAWLVWVIPTVSGLLIPLIACLGERARNYFAVAAGLVTTVFAFSMVTDVYFGTLVGQEFNVQWISELGISAGMLVDSLSVLFASLVAFFGLVILVYSLGYMAGEEGLTRYYLFMLLFIGSMIGLVMSDNFLQMFIFWEMVGLCSYSLVSFWYKRPEAVRAGTKVFLMTRVGDVSFLAAIAILYASLGSLSFSYIIFHVGSIPLPNLTAVAFLMLGGAVAKSAQFPLHTWLFSAMEAPTSVSAILHGATMVKAGVYLIARLVVLLGPIAVSISFWLPSIAWIGAVTAFLGAALALSTSDIKGVPAYSTISQIGVMMLALGVGVAPYSQGWFACLFQLTNHAFFQGLDFLLIGGIVRLLGTRDMRLMGGLRKAMPITFGLAIIVALSRTGLPPFAGFFSKGIVISGLWSTGDFPLLLILFASTMLTFAYSLRFIVLTFLRNPSDYLKRFRLREAPKIMLLCSVILAVLCVCWSFLGNVIAKFMHVNLTIGLSEAFSAANLVFLFTIFIGGFLVYVAYYVKPAKMETTKSNSLDSLKAVLERGYYLDDFYEQVIARGLVKASKGFQCVEEAILNRLPYLVANGIMTIASYTQKYFDVYIDVILHHTVNRTLSAASRIQKAHAETLQRYILASLIGFLILLILMIITLWR
jgi:NADH-quinone oxidoreductase subunit L